MADGADIREAASQANASTKLEAPLLEVVRAVRAATVGMGRVTAARADKVAELWRAEVLARVGPALSEAIVVMSYVASVNDDLDFTTVPEATLAQVAEEHLFGVAAYAHLLGATAHKASVKDPAVTMEAALERVLADERAELLADGLAVHARNGVMYAVLSVAEPLPLDLKATGSTAAVFVGDNPFEAAALKAMGVVDFVGGDNPFERTKMWVSMRDDRVRSAHKSVDGTSVPASGVFTVGGHSARYPGDPMLPAGLRINCRCFLVKGPKLGASSQTEEQAASDKAAADRIAGLIARRRDKIEAARKAVKAAEAAAGNVGGVGAAERAAAGAQSAAEAIATVLDGTPEARIALEGGKQAEGLLALLLKNSDGSNGATGRGIGLILAALIAEYERESHRPPTAEASIAVRDARFAMAGFRRVEMVTSGDDFSDGIMVCVRPTAEQTAALIFDGGLPADEIHCTLGYYGKTTEAADPKALREELSASIAAAVEQHAPIEGEVTGVTVFSGNDTMPLVALVDAPGLVALRQAIVDQLGELGAAAMRTNHDFMPHITLGYDADPGLADVVEADSRTGEPLSFGVVELVFGLESTDFELTGGTPPAAEEASDMSDRITHTSPKIRALELEDGTRFEAVPTEAAGPADLAQGQFVEVTGADLSGRIDAVETEGTVTDSQGNSLDATPEAPVYLVTVFDETDAGWAPTDVTVVATADQLTAIADLTVGEPEDPTDGPEDEPDEVMAAGDCPDCSGTGQVDGADCATCDGTGKAPEGAPVTRTPAMKPKAGMAAQAGETARRAAAGDFDWEAVLIVEGAESGDRRFIEEGALTWRELPVPLMLQTTNPETGGHAGAIICGSIWDVVRSGSDIVGRGFFDSGVNGQEARRLIDEGTIRGVSADIDMVRSDVMADASGGDPQLRLSEGRIMGATITPFPAFQEAQIRLITPELVAAAGAAPTSQVWTTTIPFRGGLGTGVVETLVASGRPRPLTGVAPVAPPQAWFAKRQYEARTPITVEADGQIYGHVAGDGECHIGFLNQCITPPKSKSGYSHFYRDDNPLSSFFGKPKGMLTAEGTLVFAGPVQLDLDHARAGLTPAEAKDTMSHTGCQVAQVAVYEDEWGIQIAGCVDPQATEAQVRVLRASDISPDWRRIDGNLELVGLVVVNTSGYPARSLVASASGETATEVVYDGNPFVVWNHETNEPDVLVAVGMVRRERGTDAEEQVRRIEQLELQVETLTAALANNTADIGHLKVLAAPQRLAHAKERFALAKDKMKAKTKPKAPC